MSYFKVTPEFVKKLLKIVDKGLSTGLGKAKPGFMCVEAAVNFAMGEKHGDEPTCVDDDVRLLKICINDWLACSKTQRAQILRRLAIAQLGSVDVGMVSFNETVIDALADSWNKKQKIDVRRLDKDIADFRKAVFKQQTMHRDLSIENYSIPEFYNGGDVEEAFKEYCGDKGKNLLKNAAEACEIIVQILKKKYKTPGSKYLHLAPLLKKSI